MRKLDVKLSQEINASASVVWSILGEGFLTISDWSLGILYSVNNPNVPIQFEGAPAGARVCDVKGFGKFDETILHYDANRKEITWSADSPKIPGFVKGLNNAFHITELDDHRCIITSNLTADLSGIGGYLFKGKMSKDFGKTIDAFLKDLKAYAETGEISQRKRKEKDTLNKYE